MYINRGPQHTDIGNNKQGRGAVIMRQLPDLLS